jgi:5'-3' exoribonuclease 1
MGMPRQAVLKPSHAVYRLQGQTFTLGDRVIMVLDGAAGGVPLGIKGVVVGVGPKDIDVVWDKPFLGGESLQGRCSEYRGSTVPFTSCLNLSRQHYALSMTAEPPKTTAYRAPFKPQLGPQPAVQMRNFVPAVASRKTVESAKGPPAGARHYDQAARGMKLPPAPPAHKYNHTDRLAGLLGGAASRAPAQWQAQPTLMTANGLVGGGSHVAHTPKAHAVPPHAEASRGGRGGRGGRGTSGRGAPRGRGRGGKTE